MERVNSTTVNLVLTIRKAVSLAISVWFYGSGANAGLLTGGAMVLGPSTVVPTLVKADKLGGTLIYSFAPPPKVLDNKKTDDIAKDVNAIPMQPIESRKVDIDDSLRRRTPKDNDSL
jgi:UDP-xylose/UDP-N-acetylglucosamine transporter B4